MHTPGTTLMREVPRQALFLLPSLHLSLRDLFGATPNRQEHHQHQNGPRLEFQGYLSKQLSPSCLTSSCYSWVSGCASSPLLVILKLTFHTAQPALHIVKLFLLLRAIVSAEDTIPRPHGQSFGPQPDA